MLGGTYWPISMMEPYMRQISYVILQRWLIDAIKYLALGAAVLRPAKQSA